MTKLQFTENWLGQFLRDTMQVDSLGIDIMQYAKVMVQMLDQPDPVGHVAKILCVLAREATANSIHTKDNMGGLAQQYCDAVRGME